MKKVSKHKVERGRGYFFLLAAIKQKLNIDAGQREKGATKKKKTEKGKLCNKYAVVETPPLLIKHKALRDPLIRDCDRDKGVGGGGWEGGWDSKVDYHCFTEDKTQKILKGSTNSKDNSEG